MVREGHARVVEQGGRHAGERLQPREQRQIERSRRVPLPVEAVGGKGQCLELGQELEAEVVEVMEGVGREVEFLKPRQRIQLQETRVRLAFAEAGTADAQSLQRRQFYSSGDDSNSTVQTTHAEVKEAAPADHHAAQRRQLRENELARLSFPVKRVRSDVQRLQSLQARQAEVGSSRIEGVSECDGFHEHEGRPLEGAEEESAVLRERHGGAVFNGNRIVESAVRQREEISVQRRDKEQEERRGGVKAKRR